MTQPRKGQLNILATFWSKYSFSTSGGVSSVDLPSEFESATVTKTHQGTIDPPVRGIVTTGSGGYVQIRNSSNGSAVLDSNAVVFGRITESSGTYTIAYLKISAGSEVSATLPVGSYDLDILFPEVMTAGEVPADANIVAQSTPLLGGGTSGDASGDLSGTYPNPKVVNLTNVTSDLTSSAATFKIDSSIGSIQIGTTTGTAITLGRSGITTTITGGLTQSSGAISLTGNGDSIVKTSSGSLTLNGSSTINIQINSSNVVAWTGTTGTIQAGITFQTTGSGNINLPNNASARFNIQGIAVSANVTATNLNTLTGGGSADTLHTHTSVSNVGIVATSGESIAVGAPVGYENSGGLSRCFNADANSIDARHYCVGLASNTATTGTTVTIYTSGELPIADTIWDSVPTTANVGALVFLSENAGKLTLTAPATSGSYTQKIGIVTVGGTGAAKIVIEIGDSFLN